MCVEGETPPHALDPAAHSTGGLRFGLPDRPEHFEHEVGVDIDHGHVAKHGIGIGGKGFAPLLAVLGVAPACLL